jgi:hypothetical protein
MTKQQLSDEGLSDEELEKRKNFVDGELSAFGRLVDSWAWWRILGVLVGILTVYFLLCRGAAPDWIGYAVAGIILLFFIINRVNLRIIRKLKIIWMVYINKSHKKT